VADGGVEAAIELLTFHSFDDHLDRLETAARTAASLLRANSIPFRIVGAMAAYLHVNAIEPLNARLTPGVDIVVPDRHFSDAVALLAGVSSLHMYRGDVGAAVLIDGLPVIPVAELVATKLTSFRLKDQVHIQDLDSVGLITPEIEAGLPEEMKARLRQVRASR
jgi:hypothetical protein